MKKFIALLLALLIPVGALAETVGLEDADELTTDEFRQLFTSEMQSSTYCLEASVTAEEARLAALLEFYLSSAATEESAVNVANLAKGLAKLFNGSGVKIVAQDNAVYFDLLLRNSSLMDFVVYSPDETLSYITSSMMPGYAVKQNSGDDAEGDALAEMLLEELKSLLPGMVKAVTPLLQEIEVERTRGSFTGDAYEGGVWCTTIRLDDRQIAEILQALLTDEVRTAATVFLVSSDLGTEETIQQLADKHEAVAQANEHRYILRFVEDANGGLVGISATVMRGDEQLRTFSLGITDNSLRIVTGVGGPQVNYWYDHLILLEKPEVRTAPDDVVIVLDGVEDLVMSDVEIVFGEAVSSDDFTLRGSCIEFVGDKDSSFAYALATLEETLVWNDWTLDVHVEGERLEWQYDAESGIAPSVLKNGMPASASVQQSGLIDGDNITANFVYKADGVECLSALFSFRPCEPIPPMSDDLIIVDAQSEDPDQQQLVIETDNLMIESMSQRMLTLLPMELMMVLLQLGL